ncbi:MAG: DUF1772 domain-containing protein [Rhodospirillales bacterium]
MTDLIAPLTLVAALGAALVAGIFFAFSNFVMQALARLRPASGIAAMQAINVTVLNPGFFALFFGTALAALALALTAAFSSQGGAYLIAGSLLYLLGCLLVTVVVNVPLNKKLEGMAPDSDEAAVLWQRYLVTWTRANHLRSLASLVAAACFVMALR